MTTRKRFSVRELCPQRAYTTDSARRSRDTLLSAEPTRRNPVLLGRTWVGNLTSQLDAMSSTDRAIAIDEAQRALAAYGQSHNAGGEMTVGAFGALASDTRPEKVFDLSTSATAEDIAGASSMVFEGAARAQDKRALSRDVARATARGILPDDLNAINARFWAVQPRLAEKKWGSGK